MGLRDISFQEEYRSGQDDLLSDFFHPSLSNSKKYYRAVGYFSSSVLETFGTPLTDFISNDGTIEMVTSVELTDEDYKAIEEGLSKREVSERRIEQIIDEEFQGGARNGVRRLCALLEADRLEIKVAIPKNAKRRGIFHEKVGIFFDDDDFVAFSGSANESVNALEEHYECIDVYTSWEDQTRAKRKLDHFNRLWDKTEKGVTVYDFPEAAKRKLIRISKREYRLTPTVSNKWRHQDEAVELFLQEERGILNMATGTGKTRTAIRIILSLFDEGKIDTAIISTDGNDLLSQWYKDVLKYRKNTNVNLRVYKSFGDFREGQNFSLDKRDSILISSRLKLAPSLTELTQNEAQRTILVHDEIHGIGSAGNIDRLSGLSDNIRYRLGLSATPDREYDADGNQFIEDHVGPVIYNFGLEDAIKRNILCPFNYFPLDYQITHEDRQKIASLQRMRAAREKAGNPMSDKEFYIAISKVYKNSRAKIPIFSDFLQGNSHVLERCIVFVETQDYGGEVLDLIHSYRPDFHTYFSGQDSETLFRFAQNELECLVTCHRLSEGIDIQSLNNVIPFSSSRARLEIIQRIGRCLRTDPNNPDKIANVVDFIRQSTNPDETNSDQERSIWLSHLSTIRQSE